MVSFKEHHGGGVVEWKIDDGMRRRVANPGLSRLESRKPAKYFIPDFSNWKSRGYR
jgi:hypothetical protein